jgi:hypothetical protein
MNGTTEMYDMDGTNNMASLSGIGLISDAFTSIDEGFDASTFPANFAIDGFRTDAVKVRLGTTTPYGAKNTLGAMLFYLHESWGVSGQEQSIIFGEADLTSVASPFLTFYYAYADGGFGGTAPSIKVKVSDDCGASWKEIKSFVAAITGAGSTASLYNPLSSEYMWIGTSLADYAGKGVLVKISVIPGTNGNALYIDEINLDEATGIREEMTNSFELNVYPNPVTSNATIEFAVAEMTNINISVINTLNQEVYVENLGSKIPGAHTASIDLSELGSGIYFIQVKAGDKVSTQKIFKN